MIKEHRIKYFNKSHRIFFYFPLEIAYTIDKERLVLERLHRYQLYNNNNNNKVAQDGFNNLAAVV